MRRERKTFSIDLNLYETSIWESNVTRINIKIWFNWHRQKKSIHYFIFKNLMSFEKPLWTGYLISHMHWMETFFFIFRRISFVFDFSFEKTHRKLKVNSDFTVDSITLNILFESFFFQFCFFIVYSNEKTVWKISIDIWSLNLSFLFKSSSEGISFVSKWMAAKKKI